MSFFTNFKGSYQDIWKAIIRPPRDLYALEELGTQEFSVKNQACKRTDIKLRNKRGYLLECSHFEPVDRQTKQLPCVIYLHGNSSSRIEGLMAMEILLPLNITVFCFDFSGCGYSEGDYISLGWYEQDDVEVVINYLRGTNTVSTLGIWGRSMGAVTALLYAQKDSSIAGLVLDSPFANLRLLIDEIAQKNTKIPKLIVNGALGLVRKTIIAKAKFDMNKLSPIDHVGSIRVPALFIAATGDDFIEPHHTRDLFERHPAKKNLILVEGDHNSIRPQHLSESIASFIHMMLLDSQDRQKDGNRHRNRKCSYDDDDDYCEGEQYLTFKIRGKSNFLMCNNELEVCQRLKKHCDDELEKAVLESIKLTQINQLMNKSPNSIKSQKKMSTTTDSSGDKILLQGASSEIEIEDVPKNYKEDEARLNR